MTLQQLAHKASISFCDAVPQDKQVYRQCDGGCGAVFRFTPRDPREKVTAFCSRCQKTVNWVRVDQRPLAVFESCNSH